MLHWTYLILFENVHVSSSFFLHKFHVSFQSADPSLDCDFFVSQHTILCGTSSSKPPLYTSDACVRLLCIRWGENAFPVCFPEPLWQTNRYYALPWRRTGYFKVRPFCSRGVFLLLQIHQSSSTACRMVKNMPSWNLGFIKYGDSIKHLAHSAWGVSIKCSGVHEIDFLHGRGRVTECGAHIHWFKNTSRKGLL